MSARRWVILAGGAIALANNAPAMAQDRAGGGANASLDAVSQCRKITGAEARLACFDQAAAALDTVRANGLVVMDKAEVREKRKSLFGFQLPRINLFGKDDSPEDEIKEVTSTLRSVSPSGRENWTLRLADGSVWRTIEPSRFDPEAGDSIRIRHGAIGSYLANIDEKRAVRVERVQ